MPLPAAIHASAKITIYGWSTRGLGMERHALRRAARRGRHAPNAKGNFCFEATLGYRRLERGR
jgi:hypothetical protein